MPTPECWEELGALRAEVDDLHRHRLEQEDRIRVLETDRARLMTLGGGVAVGLTALGVLFADAVKSFGNRILGSIFNP